MSDFKDSVHDTCILKVSYGTNGLEFVKITERDAAAMWWGKREESNNSLQNENQLLRNQVDKLTAELADLNLKCGNLSEMNENLKKENIMLNAQMEVVQMFLGKDANNE